MKKVSVPIAVDSLSGLHPTCRSSCCFGTFPCFHIWNTGALACRCHWRTTSATSACQGMVVAPSSCVLRMSVVECGVVISSRHCDCWAHMMCRGVGWQQIIIKRCCRSTQRCEMQLGADDIASLLGASYHDWRQSKSCQNTSGATRHAVRA